MQQERMKLKKLTLSGFKSIDAQGQSVEFGDINVFIGANGSGKSNLISFFKLLNYLTTGALQNFVGEQGYASSLLYYGPSITPRIQAELYFEEGESNKDTYNFTLSHASGDTLIFTDEYVTWHKTILPTPAKINLGAGHSESKLFERTKTGDQTCQFIFNLLKSCQVYQFHDTSSTAKIRLPGYIGDNDFLRSNAGNLAAFLYAISNNQEWEKYYERILRHIQAIMPQFGDFILKPSPTNNNYVRLDWQEKGKDYRFGPHQISDGSLRFMALTTLLLQPTVTLPKVIILDEPELGLHPAAIASLSSMIRTAAVNCQVILSTQSSRLVDEFKADEIVVVEMDTDNNQGNGHSLFKRVDEEALSEWLQQYNLSDLWEKNVLGGQP